MGILWENSAAAFLIFTVLIAGGAAYMSGKALADQWRSIWHPIRYMLLLGLADRFFHFALFEGSLLSLHYYLVDTAVLIAIALVSYRLKRVQQMVSQYPWLYVRNGPFAWTEK
jgi:hypothetical protein